MKENSLNTTQINLEKKLNYLVSKRCTPKKVYPLFEKYKKHISKLEKQKEYEKINLTSHFDTFTNVINYLKNSE